MAGKFALLIGNDQYQDEQFGSLTVPGNDVKALKTILENPAVGGFDRVGILLNGSLEKIMAAMGDLFANKNKDDLVLLYFSGHGALDRAGQLYLAVNQTQFKQLSSTAVWASFIKNEMNNSHSRRQVLILDCCHSGAFGRDSTGAKSAIDTEVINEATFDVKGYGREILVSSSATQLSWEGNKVIDKTDKSLFTHYLVEGLNSGKAAVEGKQDITVGQLYDYVYAKVVNAAANMTPQRWVDKLEGSIVIAKNPHPQIKAKPLPKKLLAALEDDQPFVREGAVRELGRLLKGKDKGLADTARQKLKAMQAEERDRYVWQLINELFNVNEEKIPAQINKDTVPPESDAMKSTNNLADFSANKSDIEHSKPNSNGSVIRLKTRQKQNTKFPFFTVFILVILARVIYGVIEWNTEDPYLSNSDRYSDSTLKPQKINLVNNTSSMRKPGEVFQDTLKYGTKGPEMVVIPAGSFKMGAPKSESGSTDDERPQHMVKIAKPFAIGKYEVTVGQFKLFVGVSAYQTEAEKSGGCHTYHGNGDWKKNKNKNWRSPGFSQDDRHPVVCVSWYDTNAYIKWLKEQTGKPYRLPSEAEWEYAVRAKTETSRYWGDESDKACDFSNVADKTAKATFTNWIIHECRDEFVYTAPVGKFFQNNFTLKDMQGNVWEWMQDTWHKDYQGAPEDGSLWEDEDTSQRVLRGGSWSIKPTSVRSANRNRTPPDRRSNFVGFRLAQDL